MLHQTFLGWNSFTVSSLIFVLENNFLYLQNTATPPARTLKSKVESMFRCKGNQKEIVLTNSCTSCGPSQR